MGNSIQIELGGEKRELRFSLDALSEFCDAYDIRLGQLMNEDGVDKLIAGLPVSALQKAVYLAVRGDDPDITEEQVGGWIDLTTNAQEVFQAFFGLFAEMSFQGQMTPEPAESEIDEGEALAETAGAAR